MENNQRGGVLAFSLVAIVLFAALVGGVYLVKNYGDQVAGEVSDTASEVADEVAPADDEKATDEDKGAEQPAGEEKPEPEEGTTTPDQPEAAPDDNSNQVATNDQDDDFDEVVEAPDDDTHSQTSTPSGIGTTGPSQVASTGPSEIAATGLEDNLAVVAPLAVIATSVVAYTRSRITF